MTLEQVKIDHIINVLKECRGNWTLACKKLDIAIRTLRYYIARHRLNIPNEDNVIGYYKNVNYRRNPSDQLKPSDQLPTT